jgi:hypothetical protein
MSPIQNPNSNCSMTAVFPAHVASGKPGNYNASPENMTTPINQLNKDGTLGAGCRKVTGPGDCKKTFPCERHVIVYLRKGENWDDPKKKPDYHAVGQSTCEKGAKDNYYHQTGDGSAIRGPFGDPDTKAKNYFEERGIKDPLIATHYCCPDKQ